MMIFSDGDYVNYANMRSLAYIHSVTYYFCMQKHIDDLKHFQLRLKVRSGYAQHD